jgi:hypothetical protein
LPTTPVLRREEIKLQVALASALFHVKGYTSPETIAAFERADALIERADALGEHPEGEDALLRFSVMYGQWTGNFSAGNFARAAEHAKQCLALAEKQTQSAPLLVAHRLMGGTLFRDSFRLPGCTSIERLLCMLPRNTGRSRPDLVRISALRHWFTAHSSCAT